MSDNRPILPAMNVDHLTDVNKEMEPEREHVSDAAYQRFCECWEPVDLQDFAGVMHKAGLVLRTRQEWEARGEFQYDVCRDAVVDKKGRQYILYQLSPNTEWISRAAHQHELAALTERCRVVEEENEWLRWDVAVERRAGEIADEHIARLVTERMRRGAQHVEMDRAARRDDARDLDRHRRGALGRVLLTTAKPDPRFGRP